MTEFVTYGPYSLQITRGPGGKEITDDNIKGFWQEAGLQKERRGCYVFCLRAGQGVRPIYVGKSTNSFGQEIFADHKLRHYHSALVQSGRGTAVFYLLCYPEKKGKLNKRHIDQLETFLIKQGKFINPELRNKKKVSIDKWSIKGVIRSKQGKPSAAASDLRATLGL
jgi:hypothetical protein